MNLFVLTVKVYNVFMRNSAAVTVCLVLKNRIAPIVQAQRLINCVPDIAFTDRFYQKINRMNLEKFQCIAAFGRNVSNADIRVFQLISNAFPNLYPACGNQLNVQKKQVNGFPLRQILIERLPCVPYRNPDLHIFLPAILVNHICYLRTCVFLIIANTYIVHINHAFQLCVMFFTFFVSTFITGRTPNPLTPASVVCSSCEV